MNAIVNMRSKKPIRGDFIQIEVIGKEKAIYLDLTNSENNKEFNHTFISHKQRAHEIENGELDPGEYEIVL